MSKTVILFIATIAVVLACQANQCNYCQAACNLQNPPSQACLQLCLAASNCCSGCTNCQRIAIDDHRDFDKVITVDSSNTTLKDCSCNGGDRCCCPSGWTCCNSPGRCCCSGRDANDDLMIVAKLKY